MTTKLRTALVLGAGGFIGSHMVGRLKDEGYWVRGVDVKPPEFSPSKADEFVQSDLRSPEVVEQVITNMPVSGKPVFDEIYQFAADMGGAEYLFSGDNDADVLHNSVLINLNLVRAQRDLNASLGVNQTILFYSSSACVYPQRNQSDPGAPDCREDSVYPADPDSEYGWEKLFSERIYLTFNRNFKLPVRIARYHNIFGPEGTWEGGKEKVPAAMCRKVAMLPTSGGTIDVWGDGKQTRSFLYISDCLEATRRLVMSDFSGPVNIGSEEMVSINQLVDVIASVAGKKVKKNHILDGPLGVRGRNSHNDLIREKLKWDYQLNLEEGIRETYHWVLDQVNRLKSEVP